MTVPLNQNLKRDFYESFKKRRKSSTEDLQGLFTAFNGMKYY